MKSKRFLCLLLVLLMVFSLTPSETRAETTVYFTAVNDQLLPDLSDETMPFWSGGRLYVPSTVITGTDLGLFYSRSRDKSTAVVYRQGSALTFNFAAGTVADQNDRQYSGPAIVRSDVVFLPLDLLTQFFSLDYSYTRVTYGYLVRVKSDTVVLSDAKFIDAAAMSMEQRYNEYMKTHSESNDPGNTPNQNTDGDRDLVCLALRVTDEESANALLDTLTSSGYTLCVATSKPRVFAERILDHFGIAPYFSFVGGTGLDGSLPTKADVIAHVLAGSNITDRGTALMIGDRKYDILGAKTVGIDSAGVLYGYGDRAELEAAGADYILPAIPDLEELLLE